MKGLFALLFAVTMLGCTNPPGQPEPVATDTQLVIQDIKEVYAAITKEKLTQKSFDWQADTTCEAPPMGGNLTYFYRGNEIVKMLNTGAEDHGSWKEAYYFNKQQLVFIYQNNTYGGAGHPDEFRYENRYYFYDNRLIKSIESNPAVHLDTNTIRDIVNTAYRLKKVDNSAAIARIFSCDRGE